MTIISAVIASKEGDLVSASFLPQSVQADLFKVAHDFLYSLKIEDGDVDMPYIETTTLRYVYKQTDDLYWILVTKTASDIFADTKALGQLVTTIMEYGPPETNSTTVTDEQRDLFYRHLWRPWDGDVPCLVCNSEIPPGLWTVEFDIRVQFLISIRDGRVSDDDVAYFNNLIDEAWTISTRMSPNPPVNHYDHKKFFNLSDSDSDSMNSAGSKDESIGEEVLIECCKMKCRMEDIRLEINRLQDPYLRLFARRDLLLKSDIDQSQTTGSAPLLRELDSYCGQSSTMLLESSPNKVL